MSILGSSVLQEVPWDLVNMLRPFFTPGWRLIKETVLTAPAASVTFSSIPGNYRSLVFVNQIRSSNASENVNVYWEVNGDAGNNYDWVYGRWRGDGTQASSASRAATGGFAGYGEGASSRANNFAVSVTWFPGYALTDREKFSLTLGAVVMGDVSADGDLYIGMMGSRWRNTAAIISATFYLSAGNVVAGSRFAMYGVL